MPSPSPSPSTGGTPATPDLMLAHHNTFPGHGEHPTTGGGGLRSASEYLSRRSKRRGIHVVVAAAITAAVASCGPQPQIGTKLKLLPTYRHIRPVAIHPEAPDSQQLPRLLNKPSPRKYRCKGYFVIFIPPCENPKLWWVGTVLPKKFNHIGQVPNTLRTSADWVPVAPNRAST